MYLLDANVFIQAKRLHYGFDFCPAFWSWLEREHANARVFSIEGVFDELVAGADDLASWAQTRRDLFLRPDSGTVSSPLQVADYYLVAQAHALGFTVVTHEIAANSVKKIKIPDACIGLGVRVVTPYSMLRSERARFVLGAP